MVCLPGYLYFTDCRNLCKLHPQMIVLFAKAVQHQLHCQEKFKSLQNSNANFPQTYSWWNIWSQGHQVNMWKWLAEVLPSVEKPGPFKFQFSPQRCDRQNLNGKLFHLFLQNNELYYQVYLHTAGNICDSLGEVKEQSVVNITSQLFTI